MTSRSIVKSFLWMNCLRLARLMKVFACVFQVVVFHCNICQHVHSFLVLLVLENNGTSVKGTTSFSMTNIGAVANHVKFRSCSD